MVRELLACSAALRPRHLDAAFLHRRRTRGQQGRTSQQWYVGLDDWVAGTAADATAAPAFFDLQVRRPHVLRLCSALDLQVTKAPCCRCPLWRASSQCLPAPPEVYSSTDPSPLCTCWAQACM